MRSVKLFLKWAWRPALGILGLAAVVIYSMGVWRDRVKPETVASQPGTPLPAGAEILTVKAESLTPKVEMTGTVASAESIHLSARIGGYVEKIEASAGTKVAKDQTLVVLDARELREQLAGAEIQRQQAETEFNRATQLFKTGATTEQQVTATKSALDSAKSQAERVKVMLTYSEIRSPIDGIVIDRRIEVGDLANPGQVLLTVYDPRRMRLEVPVPARLVEQLTLGQAVQTRLERPARVFPGKVTQIVSEIDPMSRTQTVKIDLEGPQGEVLPGTFGRLLLDETPRPAILVPLAAVARSGQLEIVRAVEDNRVLSRLVKTGPAQDGKVEILAGLQDGDRILVK